MKTDNELIAEFMGFSCCDTGQDRFWNPPYKPEATVDSWDYHTNHLDKFQTSWDWLMPVVEKIESIRNSPKWPNAYERVTHLFSVIIDDKSCVIHENIWAGERFRIHKNGSTKIWAVYEAVVEFIKWYNSQLLNSIGERKLEK